MIIGSLKDTQRIASFHPLFKTLFDFLANNDLSNIQLGKTELLKNKLYIICSTLEKGASREQLLEGHRKYIDVHILLEGKETIGWTPLCKALCKHKDYDEAKDYLLYTDTPSVFIDVNPGEFVNCISGGSSCSRNR